MIFSVDYLGGYMSQFMALYPGHVVNTGTPAGRALGRPGKPRRWSGDVIEIKVGALVRQRQTCKAV